MRTERTREPLIVSDECNEVTSLSPSQQTSQHITSAEQELGYIANLLHLHFSLPCIDIIMDMSVQSREQR